ncbi:MAG: protein kinase [Planctomycetota bacterium]
MRLPDESEEHGVVTAFLVELLADRERGAVRSLTDYQQRFPGFDAAIAAEYAAVNGPHVAADEAADAEARYRLGEEVGHGGMGSVHRAWEHRLQRHLAMKRVRAGASPQELRRFLEEARVTAQLHHPGVVPVHDLGVDRDGRMFFTMDLVRGRTLREVIAELHAGEGERSRALEVLQRVCEAIAFAHDKRVIHRDLKPDNVMVGRFGEVYVMDWGLALVREGDRDRVGAAQDDAIVSQRAENAPEWTLQGDVVGTAAYMAPEQARGATVDERADVYAIGAMLYEVLTGRRPYADDPGASTSQAILDRVRAGAPAPVERLQPDAPPELVAIQQRAMARRLEHRYADVLALRDDLRAFAEQRVVTAYEHGTWAELRKWLRRNRTIAAAALAAVLALCVGFAVSVVQRQRAEQAAAEANTSFEHAVDAVETLLTRVGQHQLDNVPQAVAVRRQLLQDAAAFYERLLTERAGDPALRRRAARASYRVAALHEQLGERDAALRANARAMQLQQLERDRSPHDAALLLEIAETHNQAGNLAMRVADHDAATQQLAAGAALVDELLRAGRTAERLDLAGVLHENLGVVAMRRGDPAGAVPHVERAIAALDEQLREFGDQHAAHLASVHVLRGAVLRQQQRTAEAREAWQHAVDLLERVHAAHPDDYTARKELAEALQNLAIGGHEQGDADAADAAITRALALRRANVEDFPEMPACQAGLGTTLNNLAQFARTARRFDVALDAGREAVAALQSALLREPDNEVFRNSLWLAHRNCHRAARALRHHREMLVNARSLAEAPQADATWRLTAAQWLALAGDLAANDPGSATGTRTAQRDECDTAAMAVLERALARGELRAALLEDAAFARLARTAAFAALRQRCPNDG